MTKPSSIIVAISERSRGILAFEEELNKVLEEIEEEKARHQRTMAVLITKAQALEQVIHRLNSN